MRAEFYRAGAPLEVVGWAGWSGSEIVAHADEKSVRASLARLYRRVPVAIEDQALRTAGTSGPAVLVPGSLAWFIHASTSRAAEEGLGVRFVAEGPEGAGWDPAAAYRSFPQAVERVAQMAGPTHS